MPSVRAPRPAVEGSGIETTADALTGIRARRARLRTLRHAVLDEQSGSLTIARDELVGSFALPRWVGAPATELLPTALEDRARNYVANLLKLDGFTCRPSLRDRDATGPVQLGLTRDAAAHGATAVAVLATAAGLYSHWFYGLIAAVPGVVAVWLARNCMPELDRWTPGFVPRGRLLGAVLAAILIGVAGLAVALPIRAQRTNDANVQRAEALVSAADANAAAGNTAGATNLLGQALNIDPTVPGAPAAQAQILTAVVKDTIASELKSLPSQLKNRSHG